MVCLTTRWSPCWPWQRLSENFLVVITTSSYKRTCFWRCRAYSPCEFHNVELQCKKNFSVMHSMHCIPRMKRPLSGFVFAYDTDRHRWNGLINLMMKSRHFLLEFSFSLEFSFFILPTWCLIFPVISGWLFGPTNNSPFIVALHSTDKSHNLCAFCFNDRRSSTSCHPVNVFLHWILWCIFKRSHCELHREVQRNPKESKKSPLWTISYIAITWWQSHSSNHMATTVRRTWPAEVTMVMTIGMSVSYHLFSYHSFSYRSLSHPSVSYHSLV